MAEFNKGYYRRQGRKEGIYLERERIIELLESSLVIVDWVGIFFNEENTGKSYAVGVKDIIALIKGEK